MEAFSFAALLLLFVAAHTVKAEFGARLKVWGRDTNFGNVANWAGYEGNCSKNIYSFPMDMDPVVVSFPSNTTILTKAIFLPRNGHLVFQAGPTTLFNSPADTCHGVELKFRRTSRGDWFDPNNWSGTDRLLNSGAVPHVERVPCQYDSVQFPRQSSFHLFISSDVAVQKLFLGDQELNYTKIAFLMSTQLGRIQFHKSPETRFELSPEPWKDEDGFICDNYKDANRIKICKLTACYSSEKDEECPMPLLPHGFCCPICGYHLKIQHNGNLPLAPVRAQLESRIKSLGLEGMVGVHVGRFAPKFAHIVFIPWMNKTEDVWKLIDEAKASLDSGLLDMKHLWVKDVAPEKKLRFCKYPPCHPSLPDSNILKSTLSKSWEGGSGDASGLASSEMSGGVTALLVILLLTLICGTAVLIFLWSKRGFPTPTLTLNSIISRIPTIPGIGGSPRPSFAFARFSNERVSSINIGEPTSGELRRTEEVDKEAKPIEGKDPESTSSTFGFTNLTYDLIAVGQAAAVGAGAENVTVAAAANTSAGAGKPETDEEHIYDLVEVNQDQGVSTMFDFSDSKTRKLEE